MNIKAIFTFLLVGTLANAYGMQAGWSPENTFEVPSYLHIRGLMIERGTGKAFGVRNVDRVFDFDTITKDGDQYILNAKKGSVQWRPGQRHYYGPRLAHELIPGEAYYQLVASNKDGVFTAKLRGKKNGKEEVYTYSGTNPKKIFNLLKNNYDAKESAKALQEKAKAEYRAYIAEIAKKQAAFEEEMKRNRK